MAKKDVFDFNKGLAQLEQIVKKMEQGDLTLEESLAHFEQGIQLSRACQQALTQAEQRIAKLSAQDDYTDIKAVDAD